LLLSVSGFGEALIEGLEGFGEDSCVGDGGHEVGVADPSWNDVEVKVVCDAGSSRPSDIPADIKSLGLHAFDEQFLREDAESPEVEDFIFGQCRHIIDLAVGDGHQMPCGVWVFVHNQKCAFPPGDDEVRGIVGAPRRFRQKIVSGAVLGPEVFHPPWCPQLPHLPRWKIFVGIHNGNLIQGMPVSQLKFLAIRRCILPDERMKLTAAIFDIGNVLLPFDYMRAADRLVARNKPAEPPSRENVAAAKEQLELGRIDRAEFLNRVLPEFAHEGPVEEFLDVWRDIFSPNPPIDELVAELAPQIPLYLLSNISCIHREHIHKTYPIFRHFRVGIYSYEVGFMKPDPEIFRVTIERLGVEPSSTLYIDDMPENVKAACTAGFLAVRYDHTRHGEAEARIRALME
jgi:FMN phosphatase YigB (HAD superfamily)